MRGIIFLMAIFIFPMALPYEVEGSDPWASWLGVYVGSEIPGYQIMKSVLVTSRYLRGPVEELEFEKMLVAEAIFQCQERKGKALVNVRFVLSLGDVGRVGKDGRLIRETPGYFSSLYADCVTQVKKK